MAKVDKDEKRVPHCFSAATAKAVTARLRIIRKKTGVVTARTVLDDARADDSPLHQFFDWDDSSAAERYRLTQAATLIRRIQVIVTMDGTEQPMRQYLRVVKEDIAQYIPTVEISKNPALSEQVIQAARLDLEGWLRRYEVYKAFFAASGEIRKALELLPEDEA